MMSKLTTGPYPLIAVLLLAAFLRVWGLTWGLPSATHYFSYHPDESRILQVAMGSMNLFAGKMLPHFYNYGSLQLYLVNFANSIAFLFGAVDIVPKDFAVWYPQWARMYLIGRSLTVGMGIGTVWATYALGHRLWGRRAGLLAALVLALTPLHAQHSHWLTVDVPATFWGTLSLLWAVKTTQDEGIKAALVTGLFAGLAVATKYNMALVLLPLIVACCLSSLQSTSRQSPFPLGRGDVSEANNRGRSLLFGLVAAAIAFLIACPGAVLESHKFLSDLRFESVHVQNIDDPTFKDTGNGFVFHITTNLDAGLGLPLLLLTLVSIGYAVYRRERGDGLLAAFALPYYVLISLAAVRYARYVIPLLPILALWTGRFVADLSRLKATAPRRAAVTLGALVALLTLGDCCLIVRPMTIPDNRDVALERINSLAPATIGFAVMPWFETPPVSPYFATPLRGGWRESLTPLEARRIVYAGQDWDVNLLQTAHPDLVVLSEYDYRDALRVHDPAALAYLTALRQDYVQCAVIPEPGREYLTCHEDDRLLVHNLPYDMLYTNPEITLYQRKQ